MKIILVADHASIDFGGEAALPCHYFRVLLARDIDVFLVVHERSRSFLEKYFKGHKHRIFYVPDTKLHRLIHFVQKPLPDRLGYLTFGFMLRVLTQIQQKKRIRALITNKQETIIHQVIPVSPKESSLMYGFGVPVIYGPLNGGMNYPEHFSGYESRFVFWVNRIGRSFSGIMNILFPGKKEAALLLVANKRSEAALPKNLKGATRLLVDNAVDLSLWKPLPDKVTTTPTFVYVGRLIPLKGVDILLDAFFNACEQYGKMILHIIGDGVERKHLEQFVNNHASSVGEVKFEGWLQQVEITEFLSGARALVLPSLHDCGGVVLLEAMASSVAVIATNWGGPADYLDDTCGFLVDPISRVTLVDGFSNALLSLAKDPELARKMGIAGRCKVEQEYDWERKLDEMIEIYQEQLSNVIGSE
ncbi:hypothetical protein AB835_04615 [Candidatus Endobugula sertula]|uniref:Glycosyl transferase family 1 domain-containing protein n=1 Tax=Candidatus Endobugula sertula TaxID=62101 RepID=A0A1D2QRW5_9GAMM|nr:hypothetical protein AB835_04615 [Candidatus Endobugula sertula]